MLLFTRLFLYLGTSVYDCISSGLIPMYIHIPAPVSEYIKLSKNLCQLFCCKCNKTKCHFNFACFNIFLRCILSGPNEPYGFYMPHKMHELFLFLRFVAFGREGKKNSKIDSETHDTRAFKSLVDLLCAKIETSNRVSPVWQQLHICKYYIRRLSSDDKSV